MNNQRMRLATLVPRSRLPAIYPTSEQTKDSGPMVYEPSYPDPFRRAAISVDKIL